MTARLQEEGAGGDGVYKYINLQCRSGWWSSISTARGCFSWYSIFTSWGFIGILFGIFSKNNIPNVFGRIVPKPMESAVFFGGIRISGESGSNWMVIGVTVAGSLLLCAD